MYVFFIWLRLNYCSFEFTKKNTKVRTYEIKLGAWNLQKRLQRWERVFLPTLLHYNSAKLTVPPFLTRNHHRHEKKSGQLILWIRQIEKYIYNSLSGVADWGFPCTKPTSVSSFKCLLIRKLEMWSSGQKTYWAMTWNNLIQGLDANITTTRISVDPRGIKKFFENLPTLEEISTFLINYYDKTNITEDPEAVKALVCRGQSTLCSVVPLKEY